MDFLEYEHQVSKFRLPSANQEYVLLGLVGEVGELYGKLAKHIRDGNKLDYEDIKKELGDCLWFLTFLCRDLGTSLDEVAELNVQKLTKRAAKGTLKGSGDNRE